MDFMEISRKRKTVRRFSQTPVEQEKLEKKELVYKTIDEENNARRNLHLTEKGEETFEKCIELFKDFDAFLFEGLSGEEIEKMESQLSKIGSRSLEIFEE